MPAAWGESVKVPGNWARPSIATAFNQGMSIEADLERRDQPGRVIKSVDPAKSSISSTGVVQIGGRSEVQAPQNPSHRLLPFPLLNYHPCRSEQLHQGSMLKFRILLKIARLPLSLNRLLPNY